MKDITVFGEILIDFTEAGESSGGNRLFEQNPGGAPGNVACAAARFGKKTAFIGKVGDDMHGHFLKKTLEDVGVDTTGLITDPNYFTTLAFVALNNGERTFSFARKPGADTQITTGELETSILRDTKVFHVGSLSLTHEPSRQATFDAVTIAKEAGALISYDPNYRASLWPDAATASKYMRTIVPAADVMKFSDEEAELLTGHSDIDEALYAVQAKGVKIAAATLGSKGAKFICNGQLGHVPAFNVPVVDTTGAGDAFWGGFLTCLVSSKKSLNEMTFEDVSNFVKFATGVAACCVQGRGAIPSLPDYDTLVKFLLKDK